MQLHVMVTYEGPVPGTANLRPRQWNNVLKDAWRAMGEYWLRWYLPKHFTKAGAVEYGYLPREPNYNRQKHYKPPLVNSGELRSEAPRAAWIQPTHTGCRVVLPGAKKANFRPTCGLIDMREELETVSEAEQVQLARVHEQHVINRLAKISYISRRRFS